MSKKPLWRSRLGVKLLFCAGACILLSVGIMFLIREMLYHSIDKRMDELEVQSEVAALQRLQAFVTDEGMSLSELSLLDSWRNSEKYLVFYLYTTDGELIYDSTLTPGSSVSADNDGYLSFDSAYPYTLRFSDGTVYTLLYSFEMMSFYTAADWISACAAFLLFLLLLALLIRRKLKYLTSLKDELKILEGGDLTYQIAVKGKDELSELAQGIDDMRRAMLERQAGEEAAEAANRELIASMSHDLRTPLTSLLVYLDLLTMGKYDSAAQFQHFLESSRKKGYRIKALSDKLFEYFLVYSTDWRDAPLEEFDGYEYLSQCLSEHTFDLESAGFTAETDFPALDVTLCIAPELMQRVFENLFNNIKKYGDPAVPVSVSYTLTKNTVELRIKNAVSPARELVQGTRIGLKTCERILAYHGGSFEAREESGFEVRITLPVSQKK